MGRFPIGETIVCRSRAVAAPSDPDGFTAAPKGCELASWRRRQIFGGQLERDGELAGELGVHLRMTGHLPDPARAPRCAHTRRGFSENHELRLWMCAHLEMWFVPLGTPTEHVITGLTRLGPNLQRGVNATYLRNAQGLQPPNQKCPPIRRWWLVGQHLRRWPSHGWHPPPHPAGSVSAARLEKLREALVKVLELSIGAGGTTFSDFRDLTGTNGNYGGQAWVYRRSGEPCRQCGTILRRDTLGGRSSHWCPSCQR